MSPWSQTELDFLNAHYGEMNARQIGRKLGRSQYAVHTMRKRLGLRMTKHQRSVACSVQHVNQKGERNHNWKGGISRNHARYIGRYKLANPEKVRAHIAVRAAVKRGKLCKQPCEVCGCLEVQAHHEDYSKPLDVRWLCKSHHIDADNNRRRMEREAGNGCRNDSPSEATSQETRTVHHHSK